MPGKRSCEECSEELQRNSQLKSQVKQKEDVECGDSHRKHHKVLSDLDEFDDWKREQAFKSKSDTAASESKLGDTTSSSASPIDEDPTFNPITESKKKEEFRNYKNSQRQTRVEKFYTMQHSLQTYELVKQMEAKYTPLNHFEMGVWEALEYLDKVVDDSDPDTNLTQIQHALQTAEACRRKHPGPEYDWFHLTGLIHDLGKIIAVNDSALGLPGEPQWLVVGDTFPLGCPFSDKNVLWESFQQNPDYANPRFNTGLGIYKPQCGLSNVTMSWGHDEYLYRVIVGNGIKLPLPALYMLRFHSFYPWHKENAYQELLDDQDREMLKYVKDFNECDLYSKADVPPNLSRLVPYYKSLIDKYCPGKLKW